jgi:imidazolonepropionase-like amidohydrolase
MMIGFIAGTFTACSSSKNIQSISLLVIRNVNVIDVVNEKVLPHQDVVIKDQKIDFIGRFSGKKSIGIDYIDGSGKYLLPGLWDMHFHLCWEQGNDTLIYPALLKNGITAIRDMGGSLTIMQNFKERLKTNKTIGPSIYGAGPIIDGNPPVHADFSLPVDDKTNIQLVLDSLKNGGSDFFKTYSLIKEDQLRAIAGYCSSNNMSFAGHLSEYIDPEVSISLGQKTVEHLNRLDDIWQQNQKRIDTIGALMVASKTFLCPTLITYELKTKLRDSSIVNKGYEPYITPSLMQEWKSIWQQRKERHTKLSDWESLDKTFASQKNLVQRLHKMGVRILAGTDFAGMPYVYPGISLSQELGLLAEAGLSNFEILQTATINPAICMSAQELYGSVSVGKYADLVLLDKNPIEQIANIKAIHSVFLKGKLIDVERAPD